MKNIKIAEILVFFACLSVLTLPLLNTLVVAPVFTKFLERDAEKKLVKAAAKMATLIESQVDLSDTTIFSQEFLQKIEENRELLGLIKIKIFTPSGLRIYSTDELDVGGYSQQEFFLDLVANTETRSQLAIPDEGNTDQKVFVVETYVPIIKSGRAIGVFEIYYDVTETRRNLSEVVDTINWIVFPTSLFLLLAVLGSSFFTRRSSLLQEKAEGEKDILIKDLSTALSEIKTLRGILPLCSYCKKIRDDRGYWEQVDVYIHQNSDADISHGICPDCTEEHFPEFNKKILARKIKDLSESQAEPS